jgi:hypothetical protein
MVLQMVLQMQVNGLRSNGGSMATLGLLFVQSLNIPYSTSSYQQLRKGETIHLDSPLPMIFGSQYQAFSTSKYFTKLASHSSYN